MIHLWEIDHPYYCSASYTHNHESWRDFIEEWGTADEDYNCLFRWDWCPKVPDDEIYTEEDKYAHLKLIYILQRKGLITECVVRITEEDEAQVKTFLAKHCKHMQALWEPFNLVEENQDATIE